MRPRPPASEKIINHLFFPNIYLICINWQAQKLFAMMKCSTFLLILLRRQLGEILPRARSKLAIPFL